MNYSTLALLAVLGGAQAFAPMTHVSTSSTQLFAAKTQASDLIKEAIAAGKKYGASSPEARLAWEAVEEVNASDNSEATKGTLADECLTDEVSEKACKEYDAKLSELQALLSGQQPILNSMKDLANEVSNAVKLSVPEPSVGAPSPKLLAAVTNAKKITEKKGITSSEAKLAWAEVEEIAAAGTDNAMGANYADECLIEAARDACAALEELNRVLSSHKK